MKPLKILFIAILIVLYSSANSAMFAQSTNFIVKSDPRVELLSIVFTLAGNSEYGRSSAVQYKNDVMAYFGKFKDHEAVKLARENRNKWGVSYDAVMSMAVHIKNTITIEEKVPFTSNPEKLDKRWKLENAEKFLAALRNFVIDTDFQQFIKVHSEFYKTTSQRLQDLIAKNAKLEWYDSFFGKRAGGLFILVPGYLTGGGNYGVGFKDPKNGIDEMYSITSISRTDENGIPVFDPGIVSTVIHEFCHSYTNPVVEKNLGKLRDAGEKIFPFVSKKMSEQAYGQWSTMMIESVVRVCVNKYLKKNSSESAVQADIKYNIGRGFIWMDDLSKLFNDYESNRHNYTSLDDFFPKVIKFFNDYSKVIKEKASEIDKEKENKIQGMKEKGPKIISTTPTDGDMNVDPATQYFTANFDRELSPSTYSFCLGTKAYPSVEGNPVFENGNKTVKLKVKLKPNTEYEIWLNKDENLGLKGKDNIPLYPVLIKFKTKQELPK
jgi:hypothetical protein